MKVLLVNNRYPSSSKPQVATYIKSIKTGLEKAGCEVELLVSNRNWNSPLGKWADLKLFWFKLLFFGSYAKYDFVYLNHFNLYSPFILRKKTIAKCVYHWHGNEVFSQSKIWKVLNKFTLRKFPHDAIHIAPSAYFKEIVESQFGLKNVFVSPSGGIDVEVFKPETEIKKEKLIIGYASHVNREKGFDLFLDLAKAFEQNESVELVYIKYGSGLSEFDASIKAQSNLRGVQPIPKENMPSYYNSLSVLIMPTKRSAESLGLVSLEAMSCGIPVIGTNKFALPEYILPGVSGELFEFSNAESLIGQTKKTLGQLNDYRPREVALKSYGLEAVADGYKKILVKV